MVKVMLIGRLTADPELRTTNSGISVCSFTVAVDRRTKTENKADFIDCTAWRGEAEFICKYFQKGKPICASGALMTSSYKDKDGNKRKKTFVSVENVEFVPSDKTDRQQVAGVPEATYSAGSDEDFQLIEDGDVPF